MPPYALLLELLVDTTGLCPNLAVKENADISDCMIVTKLLLPAPATSENLDKEGRGFTRPWQPVRLGG